MSLKYIIKRHLQQQVVSLLKQQVAKEANEKINKINANSHTQQSVAERITFNVGVILDVMYVRIPNQKTFKIIFEIF